mgnify:CR=1 FL=1
MKSLQNIGVPEDRGKTFISTLGWWDFTYQIHHRLLGLFNLDIHRKRKLQIKKQVIGLTQRLVTDLFDPSNPFNYCSTKLGQRPLQYALGTWCEFKVWFLRGTTSHWDLHIMPPTPYEEIERHILQLNAVHYLVLVPSSKICTYSRWGSKWHESSRGDL